MDLHDKGMVLSEDRQHVYARWWPVLPEGNGICTVIGLHPESGASENIDETTQICLDFARNGGYQTLVSVNLYSQTGMDQNDIRKADAPFNETTDLWIYSVAQASKIIIAAWGDFPWIKLRSRQVMKVLAQFSLFAVQVNSNGSPSHPRAWRMKAAKLYRQGTGNAASRAG